MVHKENCLSSRSIESGNVSEKETVRNSFSPIQTWLVKKVGLPYPVVWFIISSFFFLLYIILSIITHEQKTYVGCHATISIILFIATAGIIWAYKLFKEFFRDFQCFIDLPVEKVKYWYDSQLSNIYNTTWSIISGTAGAVIVIIATQFVFSLWHSSLLLKSYCLFWYVFGGFWCGAVVYPIIMAIRFPFRLTRMPLKLMLYQPPGCGLRAIGGMLFQMALSSALNFGLIALVIFLSPLDFNWFIFAALGCGGVILLCWFLLPQYKIHRTMLTFKHGHMMMLAPHLEDCFNSAIMCPSDQNMKKLDDVLDLQKKLEELPEWPFEMRKFLVLVSSILIPLTGILINLLLK